MTVRSNYVYWTAFTLYLWIHLKSKNTIFYLKYFIFMNSLLLCSPDTIKLILKPVSLEISFYPVPHNNFFTRGSVLFNNSFLYHNIRLLSFWCPGGSKDTGERQFWDDHFQWGLCRCLAASDQLRLTDETRGNSKTKSSRCVNRHSKSLSLNELTSKPCRYLGFTYECNKTNVCVQLHARQNFDYQSFDAIFLPVSPAQRRS